MWAIDDKLISDDLFEVQFVCDLAACKGACCVQGDGGAPLEDSEAQVLAVEYRAIKPFLRQEGISAIEEQGLYVSDADGDLLTPLVDNAECAYAVFRQDGTALCGIEQAYRAGSTTFHKPISCHLYPLRITTLSDGSLALNYHRWAICAPACRCGSELKVPVFRFLREAIIRRFGETFYREMEAAYAYRQTQS